MKRLWLGIPVVLLAACDGGVTAPSADPEASASFAPAEVALMAGNKLQCEGECVLLSGGTAQINTLDGGYGAVYILNSNLSGKLLSQVNKLAFSYSGTGAAGGSPRISLPIDTDGDGIVDLDAGEGYAFIDVNYCTDGTASAGTVDAINDPTCTIWLWDGRSYATWDAFVAANPTYRVAEFYRYNGAVEVAVPFVVVDQPGDFIISNVQIGRGSSKTMVR